MVNISTKQKRIVKSKIKGLSNKDIGAKEYPEATPESQAVLVSREVNKPHVAQYLEQSKMIALKEHNITWSRIIKPISDALEAGVKRIETNEETGELTEHETIDHNTRLRASKQAQELLQVKQMDEEVKEQLQNLPSNVDEIQLIRLMKK